MMITLGLFLMSLNSYYFKAISGAPLPVIGVMLVWYSSQKFYRPRSLELILACLIAMGIVVGLWRGASEPAIRIWPANIIGWFVAFATLMTNLEKNYDKLIRGLRIFLVVHVGFFFIQSFTYMLFAYYIDSVKLFTGEESRYMAEQLTMDASIFSIRPTGLFLEPSDYAACILPVALIYHILTGRLSLLIVAALGSVVLTFSSWAFAAVALSSILFVRKDGKSVMIIAGIVAFFLIFSEWFFTRTFDVPYDVGYTPADLRHLFAERVLDSAAGLSPGLGVGVAEPGIEYFFAINDSGSPIYLFYVFGIYAVFLLIALFWAVKCWQGKVLLLLILTSKLMPTYPFFWLLMNLLTRDISKSTVPEQSAAPRSRLPRLAAPVGGETLLDRWRGGRNR